MKLKVCGSNIMRWAHRVPLSDQSRHTEETLASHMQPSQRRTGCPLLATHHEVSGRARVGMPEVDGIHAESLLQLVLVLDPVGFQRVVSS